MRRSVGTWSGKTSEVPHVPFRGVKPGYGFRNDPPGKAHPIPRPQTGTQPPPTAFSVGVSPDKTCQNKPVPFWQVLEANGEGNLVAAAADRSAPAMGFGDGTHHG